MIRHWRQFKIEAQQIGETPCQCSGNRITQQRQSCASIGFKHWYYFPSSPHTAANGDQPTSSAPDKSLPTMPACFLVPEHPNPCPTARTLPPITSTHIQLSRYCDVPSPFAPSAGNSDCDALVQDFFCSTRV